MNFKDYQEAANRTSMDVEIDNRHTGLLYSTIGLVGEAGELANLVKKVVFHGHEFSQDAIENELGDCLWYLTDIATRCGLTLEDIAGANIEKLLRRYPNGFSKSDSQNRKD